MSRQIIAGRWEVTRSLGQGGMGDVYLGYDLDTDEEVAIKLLKPDVMDAMPDLIGRFKREADLLLQLNHPHIVRIISTVDEDDLHYLVMDYLPGGTLKDMIAAEGALPIDRVLNMALDLGDALTRAHRLHIIHRDLKPANVLLADDGSPRLSDFGISRVADSTTLTKSGALVGTINYASPEACQGREITTRSDIWSFGVMLCEMLTGINPFSREQIAATVTAILNAPPPDLEDERPDAPLALIDLIYRMLEKNPDDRISSMRRVGAELEAILQGDQPAEPGGQRPPRPPASMIEIDVSPHTPPPPRPVRASLRQHLHTHQTPFVGREGELANIDQLMRDPAVHLVNLTAPGGMGKTRLALEYAQRKIGQFPNGVYFVPLASSTSREDVVLAIADAIRFGFSLMGDREKQLLTFLKDPAEHHMLLVLDNLEHMLDEVVPLINVILRAAPDIHILTTARVRLNLNSEYVYEVGGMDVPADLEPDQLRYHEVVQLFANSARRAQPGFKLKDDDLPHVLRICRSVIGNPLGIVLAGAWIEMLSPAEIADEVAISLDFLQTDAHDVPERQRSMRAIFESSWNMLTETERDAFMKLSIFRGGVKRTIAQYITGASLQTLAALVKKSLVRRDPDTGRYELHELLRQYAAEQLDATGQTERTRDMHAFYFLSLPAQQVEDLRGGFQQAEALRTIDADFENARHAWEWACQRKKHEWIELGMEGVFLFCIMMGEYDAFAALSDKARARFMPAPDVEPDRLWRQVAIRGELARTPHGDLNQIGWLLELARQAGDPTEEAFCLWTLGYALCAARRYDEAVEAFGGSWQIFQQINDAFFTGRTMSDVGVFSAVIEQHEQSIGLLLQSMEFQQQIGDAVGLAQSQMRMVLNIDFLPPEMIARLFPA